MIYNFLSPPSWGRGSGEVINKENDWAVVKKRSETE
jgi:hypothetical protein